MTAYEFHWEDKEGREYFLGILVERRQDPKRITSESIKKWGKTLIGEWVRISNIRFRQIEV